jgi:hypothetical protein
MCDGLPGLGGAIWRTRAQEFETFTSDPEVRQLTERENSSRISYHPMRDLQRRLRVRGKQAVTESPPFALVPPPEGRPSPGPPPRRVRWQGGAVALIGFLLSPLSWWNDLFINIPLALAAAWLVSLVWPQMFTAAFVAAYWLTNLLGLVLLQKGAHQAWRGKHSPYSACGLGKDALVALGYTGLILLLVKLHVLRPLPDYFPSFR